MKFLVAFSCFLAIVSAKPGGLHGAHLTHGFGYSALTAHAPAAEAIIAAPAFAHHRAAIAVAPATATSAITTHSAIAHPASLPAVAAAPVAVARYSAPAFAHAAAPIPEVAQHAALVTPAVINHHHAAYAAPVAAVPVTAAAYAAPVAAAYTAPVAAAYAAPIAIQKSQYHAQDFLGQASYGHSEAFQHHHAAQDAAGNKVGSYSWVAPDGQVIAAKYVADALGYRVHSNAVPIGPAPVADTPEVVAARSAHLAAHIAAKTQHHLDI